jgi:uncharacterized protein (DUF362 family)
MEINKSIGEALDLLDLKPVGSVNCVDLKVNLCYYWPAATGNTTDARVVAGVIDWVRERHGSDINIRIVEADGTGMRTKYAFTMLGYEKLANEKKVELFNLSTDTIEEKKVSVNGREIAFQVPLSLLKSDLFINIPKLKILGATKITCALKNMFGCIASPRKIIYHPILNEAIVGINKILQPNLTIVDGLIALGRVPVELGLIMASADPFSIDWVASQIMGYTPSSVGYLKMAAKEKVGCSKGIILRGENINGFRNRFPKAPFFTSPSWRKLQFGLVRWYGKVANDVIPPMLEKE